MTPAQLAEAKSYGRRDLACTLADKLLDIAYLAVAVCFLAEPLDGWLQRCGLLQSYDSLRLLALFAVIFALHVAISFPLTFYAGHLLEHRYGLSRQGAARWLRQYAKRLALALVFGLAMWLGLFWLIWIVGPWWWLCAALAFFLVSVALGQLAPVLILPLFYKIEPLEDAEVTTRLGRLAEGTELSIGGVYRIRLSEETVKANAMLAGLGRTRRVLLGDTLLQHFTLDEIAVIFAHEVGHHVHRHLQKMLVAGALYSVVGFWLCQQLLVAWAGPGSGPLDYGSLSVSALPLLMLVLMVFLTVLEPLQNFLSRFCERQADRFALAQTGQPDAYRSAFEKLAQLNKDDPQPHWLDVLLFHSHPPIDQRLAMAAAWAEGTSSGGAGA